MNSRITTVPKKYHKAIEDGIARREAEQAARQEHAAKAEEKRRQLAENQPPRYLPPKASAWWGFVGWRPFGRILGRFSVQPFGWFAGVARFWLFWRTISGPRVSRDEYNLRMIACHKCPNRHLRPVKTKKGPLLREYCGLCGCPEWKPARLENKNWWARWKCPARKHAGHYPSDWWLNLIPEDARERMLRGGGQSGGCPGCGGR